MTSHSPKGPKPKFKFYDEIEYEFKPTLPYPDFMARAWSVFRRDEPESW